MRDTETEVLLFVYRARGHKKHRWPIETGKGEETDSPLGEPRRNQPY